MSNTLLTKLALVDFRNIERAVLEPSERFNIIAGHNGAGKTNLLEAIYLLGSLRSFRTTSRGELIRHGADEAKVSGAFGGAAAGLQCEIAVSRGARTVRIDGKAGVVPGEHFRTLPMVLFHPAHMELIKGGPDVRRRFLDRALFQASPTYPGLHRDYAKALASRNLLIKTVHGQLEALEPFDVQLAQLGSQIVAARGELLSAVEPVFTESTRAISGGREARLQYRPNTQGDAEAFLERIRQKRSFDEMRGYTTVGPQADDFEIALDEKPARKFASQGQKRALVLALKIAETHVLTETTGRIPLMLLDDISSELDRERNRYLFDFLATVGGQVFITTTHEDHILIESDRRDFTVEDGVVAAI